METIFRNLNILSSQIEQNPILPLHTEKPKMPWNKAKILKS